MNCNLNFQQGKHMIILCYIHLVGFSVTVNVTHEVTKIYSNKKSFYKVTSEESQNIKMCIAIITSYCASAEAWEQKCRVALRKGFLSKHPKSLFYTYTHTHFFILKT